MIGRLKGTVAFESADGTVVIDVQGVGYEVLCPLGTLGRAPRDDDGRVTLLVQTHVREDAITLFAFADERERGAFRLLNSVAGVGPRIAVAILGALPVPELAAAVARADHKRLQSVPGVGKKLAERLALELKDKLAGGGFVGGAIATSGASVPAASAYIAAPPSAGALAQLVGVLVNLGFKPPEAERAAATLRGRESEPLDVLTREALRALRP